MSRQFRNRITALAMGGLILGAPLLTNGTANAAKLGEVSRQVTFGGGAIVGLSCRSQPDVESLVVPAESTIRVVNQTGYSARLILAGKSRGTLADDAATEVVFRRGTTAVALKPNCPIGDDFAPLMVTASPSAAAATPTPQLAPTGGDSSSAAAEPSDSASPAGPNSPTTLSDSSTAERPHRTSGKKKRNRPHDPVRRTTAGNQAATAAMQAMPQGGNASKIKTKMPDGTAGSPPPAFSGMPPGDQKELVPAVPQLDLATSATQEAEPAAVTPSQAEAAAAEPVAELESLRQGGSIGLLGLVAAVCVMGVGAAAIRAIVSQRANRSNMA